MRRLKRMVGRAAVRRRGKRMTFGYTTIMDGREGRHRGHDGTRIWISICWGGSLDPWVMDRVMI